VRLPVLALALTVAACSADGRGTEPRADAAAPATHSRPGPGERADPGRIVPAFPLVNQDGRPFTMRDFAGRGLVTTFIFTRCPMPDFCPLMVKHLETVREPDHAAVSGKFLAT
jgi:protein SCO1/2